MRLRKILTATLLLTALDAPAFADVVTDWNAAALEAIRAARTPPPVASRTLAILHVSIYDAVNGISRTHREYLVRSAVPASASREAAAAAAAHRVLMTLLPGDFDALLASTLSTIREGPRRDAGVAWGAAVASVD